MIHHLTRLYFCDYIVTHTIATLATLVAQKRTSDFILTEAHTRSNESFSILFIYQPLLQYNQTNRATA